jgi:hypothetical protein
MTSATGFMAAAMAAFSCSVRSTTANDLLAKRDQKAWQAIEQNHTKGRVRFERTGSNQPKPRLGCRQTAHSVPRGCQHRSLDGVEEGIGDHAAILGACFEHRCPDGGPVPQEVEMAVGGVLGEAEVELDRPVPLGRVWTLPNTTRPDQSSCSAFTTLPGGR